jgi:hypothetical protein
MSEEEDETGSSPAQSSRRVKGLGGFYPGNTLAGTQRAAPIGTTYKIVMNKISRVGALETSSFSDVEPAQLIEVEGGLIGFFLGLACGTLIGMKVMLDEHDYHTGGTGWAGEAET